MMYQTDSFHRVKREAQNMYWKLLTKVEMRDQRNSEQTMAIPLTQQFFEDILGCLSEGVIIIDSSDRIMIWNVALGSILHLDPSRALGKRYQEVFSIHPQLGLIGVLHSMRMQHPPGTMVRTSVEGSIPVRGQISLNLCIHLLANISQAYMGMVIVIDDRTDRLSRK